MSYRVLLEDGRVFVADGPPVNPDPFPKLDNAKTDEEVVAASKDMWERALRSRLHEIEKLRLCEMAYSGFHYRHPEANRTMEITNHCLAAVEALVPAMVESRPRPEFMGRRSVDDEVAERIQEAADWWQDLSAVDQTRRICARAKAKFGYALVTLAVDYATGIPYPSYWSPFHWIPDSSAGHLRDCEFHFLAAPIQTRRLKRMFPHKADQIQSDNFVSPEWEAVVLPRIEAYSYGGGRRATTYGPVATNVDATYPYSQGSASGTTNYVFVPYSDQTHSGTETTYLVQLLVRDSTEWRAVYPGQFMTPARGADPAFSVPGYHEARVPCCPSGWRLIQFTADGTVLHDAPLDECFMGLPFVVDYLIEHESRVDGVGIIENIWPMNRSINEQKNLLNRSLRIAAAPVLKASKGHGIRFNQSGVQAGDVLEPTRGSEISWLEYDGPSEQHFGRIEQERRDIQLVAGTPEIMYGQRPTGVEAAAAFRELGDRADVRTRGMMLPALDAWSQLVAKALYCMSRKLTQPLMFKASNGKPISVTKEDLSLMFQFKAGEGSGTIENRRNLEEKYLGLYDRGLMTPDLVLKAMRIPGWQDVAARIDLMRMSQAARGSGGMDTNSGSE